jgi:hypothetical protein
MQLSEQEKADITNNIRREQMKIAEKYLGNIKDSKIVFEILMNIYAGFVAAHIHATEKSTSMSRPEIFRLFKTAVEFFLKENITTKEEKKHAH